MDEMFNTRWLSGPDEKYILAKTIELICETVADINSGLVAQTKIGESNLRAVQDQQIIAAAKIYERSFNRLLPVDHVAGIVGLNRNQLTDGFKAVFDKTLRNMRGMFD